MPDQTSSSLSLPIAGAAVVCLCGDQVLLVRRAQPPGEGSWSFPGGRIEAGETAREAALRELMEETGVTAEVREVIDMYDAIFPPYHFAVADFLAIAPVASPPRAAADVSDARWAPLSELDSFEISDAMKQVLDRALWLRDFGKAGPPALGLSAPDARALHGRIRGLYVITAAPAGKIGRHYEMAEAALTAGARLIQLRDKQRDAGELLPVARRIRDECERAGALFVVNDRVDLALACAAHGVHLGQSDLPVPVVRRMVGPGLLIGLSVEDEAQAAEAEALGANYVGVGPIWSTASKDDAGAKVGLDHLRRLSSATRLPAVAIGGATANRIPDALAAGAAAVAVISALAGAEEMQAAARRLVLAASGEQKDEPSG